MRAKRLLGGVFAACLLAVLVVGVPALLVAGLGNPLPDWSALRAGNISDQMLLQLLGCVLWIAWAQWLPGTLLEVVAGVRDVRLQRSGRWRVQSAREPRHISAGQGLSRALVTAIVGLAIATPIVAGAGRAWAAPAPAGHGHIPAVSTASLTHAASEVATPGERSSSSSQADSNEVGTRTETRGTTPSTTHPVFVVGSDPAIGPSLWSIAQHTLGDPLRWRDIWTLNRDRPMTGGTVFTDPDEIRDGWELRLPNDATVPKVASPRPGTEITVHSGDTVDGIADDAHVNGQRLVEVNLGRNEPGGRVFDDPNLILPGWKLRVPGSPDSDGEHTAPSHRGDGSPNHHTPNHSGHGGNNSSTPTTPPSRTPMHPPAQPSPTPAHSSAKGHPAAPLAAHRSSSELPMLAFIGGGSLLAGVSLTALIGYRRRQFRHRHPGNTISGSPPELLHAERTLLSTGGPAVLDVTWLDHVLRGLVHGMDDGSESAEPAARLPDVVAVRLARDELELVLGSAQSNAPAPWRVDETGTRWTIPRGEECEYDPARRAYHFAPFPTLVSVGYAADGSQWLLDLERLGSMSLAGDPQRCLDLARFLACELAHNSWSEMLHVTLVGFGEEIVAGNPDRLTSTADFEAAIAEVHDQVDSVNAALSERGHSVLATRISSGGESWVPHVLLLAPSAVRDPDGLDRLLVAMRQQRCRTAVAVVLADDPEHTDATAWTLTVDAEGMLSIPDLGLELTAQRMPADEAAEIARLLALAASTRDAPMPRSAGRRPWDRFADAAGALRFADVGIDEPGDVDLDSASTEDDQDSTAPAAASGESQPDVSAEGSTHAVDVPALHQADASPWMNASVLPLPQATYLERAATTAEDLAALAPQTSDAIRETVEATVGDLDADLADWSDPESVRPRVSLLGPVLVRAQGTLPQRNPRTEWHTEIVAYLATRPRGVTAEEYGTALWPNDPDIIGKSKVRQSASIVRKWLGKNPITEAHYLPTAMAPGHASYRIEDALVDAELFRRLRLRGLARGKDGIDDLWAALKLVTGEPFSERRAEGYPWLADNPLHHIYSAMIVDVAHTVATYHLGAGEPERAAEAAQIALDAGSTEDVPLLDKVAACDAQDLAAEADAFVKRILDNHDVDCEEDLPERTFTVLTRTRRNWFGTAS